MLVASRVRKSGWVERSVLRNPNNRVARSPGKESAVPAPTEPEPTPAAMPAPVLDSGASVRPAALDFDRHFRRAVWITTLCVIIGAGIVYAGKAADDRSAFIRWRHQVLQFWDGENIYDAMMFPNPPIMPLTLLPFMLLPPVAGRCLLVRAQGRADRGLGLALLPDGPAPGDPAAPVLRPGRSSCS